MSVKIIQIRTKWESDHWAEAWAVVVSEYLAVIGQSLTGAYD